jgi:DNA repair protein RecN (Recombination protein N)
MLKRLRVTGFALIDEAEVEFGDGLNVLSGETGAGKSLLVDSLALLLGSRASVETIRPGCDQATIEGLFIDGGGETLVRRDIRRDKTSRCSVNGELVTLRMLSDRAASWGALHGQHEDILLLRPAHQRALLDAFAGADELAARTATAADRLAALESERRETEKRREDERQRLEFLKHELQEIEAARIDPSEEESLADEARRLTRSIDRARLAADLRVALDGDPPAVSGTLGAAQRAIDDLAGLDARTDGLADRLRDARYELDDVALELSRYAETIEHDPERLAEVEARRQVLFDLKRKHGGDLSGVLEKRQRMVEEIASIEARLGRYAELGVELEQARSELATTVCELADVRESATKRLEGAIRERLVDLGIGDGTFRVAIDRRPQAAGIRWGDECYAWTRGGLEDVQLLIAPNEGEGLRPLAKIASGGELSRILLAIKAAIASADRTPMLIFDEIDAGIGGAVGHRVAGQLAAVAHHHQVIVVTHLAQIAAAAHRHLVIDKWAVDGRTVSRVRAVESEERVLEVSRLLGGDPERQVSREHAQELLGGRV